MKIHRIFVLIFISLSFYSCHNNRQIILNSEVCGEIKEIYRDDANHASYTLKVDEENRRGHFLADLYPPSWGYASVGDSVIKKRNESFITIKKRDGSSKTFETRIQ